MSIQLTEWLNRIGIILSFLAGFMLAPELIGEERIKKFERTLEFISDSSYRRMSGLTDRLRAKWRFKIWVYALLASIYSYSLLNNKTWEFYLTLDSTGRVVVFVPLIIIFGSLTILWLLFERDRVKVFFLSLPSNIKNIHWWTRAFLPVLLYPVILFVVPIVLLLLTSTNLMLIIILSPLVYSTKKVKTYLEGENRVRTIIILVGLLFFIVGNLLQFIATFGE